MTEDTSSSKTSTKINGVKRKEEEEGEEIKVQEEEEKQPLIQILPRRAVEKWGFCDEGEEEEEEEEEEIGYRQRTGKSGQTKLETRSSMKAKRNSTGMDVRKVFISYE